MASSSSQGLFYQLDEFAIDRACLELCENLDLLKHLGRNANGHDDWLRHDFNHTTIIAGPRHNASVSIALCHRIGYIECMNTNKHLPRTACPGVGLKDVPTIHEFTGYRMCPVCEKEVAADFRTGGLRWHAQLPQAAKKETQ